MNPPRKTFYVRTRGELWDWLRNSEDKPLAFDTRTEAEYEISLRVKRTPGIPAERYEVVAMVSGDDNADTSVRFDQIGGEPSIKDTGIVLTEGHHVLSIAPRERATALAALVYWSQRNLPTHSHNLAECELIASTGRAFPSLDAEELEQLVKRVEEAKTL
jgi:hypothetical protein